jgi:putative ABC transport system ATP-binding protein
VSAFGGSGVQVEALEVRYADRVALHDVDLLLPAGTMVAVTGSSGSGKSALLWALAGALAPAAGVVRLDGEPLADRSGAARAGVALMPQGGALVSTLTATENVVVSLLSAGVSATDAWTRTGAALAEVGLEEEGDHLPEELSGGQQQRVAVAVVLASQGRVLLLDEPTSELDAGNRQRVLAALRAAGAAGSVVVVATHDPEPSEPGDAELRLDDGVATWVRATGR